MNLTSRERKAAVIGGIIAGFVFLVAYVIAPLARTWSLKASQLEPKLRQIAELTERARQQDSLVRQRNARVGRLGSLLGPEALAAQGRANTPPPGSGESRARPEEGNSEGGEEESPPTEKTGDTAPAAAEAAAEKNNPETREVSSGVSLAAHLERIAKKSGVKIKRISPKGRSGARKSNKHFNTVALQVSLESNMQNLIKLLYEIEKGERLVRVEEIRLRRDLKKGDNVATTIDVVGYEAAAR